MLEPRRKLKSVNGTEYVIVRKLGEGGQGEVHEVGQDGQRYALKWYFPHSATDDQRAIIENLIRKGEPSPAFLWPKDLLVDSGTFGYIMPLRPPNFRSIVDMMKRRAEPSFRALCIAGVNVCAGYQKLHSAGYSYRDISFGNVFFDPDTGAVLICDNDNVSVDGLHDSGVCGTPRFMAPEIVKGEAGPSTDTDLYSLAVLLFYMFMLHHPLEGRREAGIKCLDVPAMNKLYGTEPLFIWDPRDRSNRPVKGYQDNAILYWDLYPAFLKELFTMAFTEGIGAPKKRVVERVWQDAFVRLLNSIIHCLACGAENLADTEKQRTGVGHVCWQCQRSITLPPTIVVGRHTVFLNRGTKILRHHIHNDFDVATEVGVVAQHPRDRERWGITNLSDDVWIFVKGDGSQSLVAKGKTAPIATGATINFGAVAGQYAF